MSSTHISLQRWGRDEWPEHVTVSHDGLRELGRRYVPERTCCMYRDSESSDFYGGPTLRCGACGAPVPERFTGPYNFCPCCGARVTGVSV